MGTDITWNVEIRQEDGTWEHYLVDKPHRRQQGKIGLTADPLSDEKYWASEREWDKNNPWHYDGRNYALFGILAGVRKDQYPQIAPLRGLPADLSDSVMEDTGYWDYRGGGFGIDPEEDNEDDREWIRYDNDHCHTWYTLQELMDFNWHQEVLERHVYLSFDNWSRRVSGEMILPEDIWSEPPFTDLIPVVTEDQAKYLLIQYRLGEPVDTNITVRCSQVQPLIEAGGLGYFVNRTIPGLEEIAPWEVLSPVGEEEERLYRLRKEDPKAAQEYLTLTKRRGAQKDYTAIRIIIWFNT